MSRKPRTPFQPSSPALRTIFAVVAVSATLGIGQFIDALAHGAGTAAPLIVKSASSVVVAQR